MSTTRAPRGKGPRFSWADVPLVDQQAILAEIGGDGHTLWDPQALKDAGLNAQAIDYFTRVEKSDGSWKGSIWGDNGQMIKEVRAVYGLSLIRSLAAFYGFESHAFGRGTEARQLTEQLAPRLAELVLEREQALLDWEGPLQPEYSERDDEARDEMERGL